MPMLMDLRLPFLVTLIRDVQGLGPVPPFALLTPRNLDALVIPSGRSAAACSRINPVHPQRQNASGGDGLVAPGLRLGEGSRNLRRQGVPWETCGSCHKAFPPISALARPPRPLISPSRGEQAAECFRGRWPRRARPPPRCGGRSPAGAPAGSGGPAARPPGPAGPRAGGRARGRPGRRGACGRPRPGRRPPSSAPTGSATAGPGGQVRRERGHRWTRLPLAGRPHPTPPPRALAPPAPRSALSER